MKLCYRGVSYEREPLTLEVTEGEIVGKYRGQTWHYHYPRHVPPVQSKTHLTYRGLSYGACSVLPEELESMAQPSVKQISKVTKTHLENIHRNIKHRVQIAQAKGDENLMHLLEEESKQLEMAINL